MGSANANTNARELTSELTAAGFKSVGFTGSHERWRSPDRLETVALIHHGTGERPKNAFNVRRAIRRYEERRDLAAAVVEREDMIELSSLPVRMDEQVQALPVASARIRGLAKSPELAQRNLFTAIPGDWRSGTWGPLLAALTEETDARTFLVRRWLDDGDVEVYWASEGSSKLIYRGTANPDTTSHTFDRGFTLSVDQDAGGVWALGEPYRFRWQLCDGIEPEEVWSGLGTAAEALEAAQETYFALVEEIEAFELAELDRATTPDPETPMIPTPTTTETTTPTTEELLDRLLVEMPEAHRRLVALLPSFQTPAIRLITGRAFTLRELVEMALVRGVDAIETELKR